MERWMDKTRSIILWNVNYPYYELYDTTHYVFQSQDYTAVMVINKQKMRMYRLKQKKLVGAVSNNFGL